MDAPRAASDLDDDSHTMNTCGQHTCDHGHRYELHRQRRQAVALPSAQPRGADLLTIGPTQPAPRNRRSQRRKTNHAPAAFPQVTASPRGTGTRARARAHVLTIALTQP